MHGVSKMIVEINNPQNEYFEKAILIVRPEKSNATKGEIDREASIFSATFNLETPKNQKKTPPVFLFILTGLGAASITAGLAILAIMT